MSRRRPVDLLESASSEDESEAESDRLSQIQAMLPRETISSEAKSYLGAADRETMVQAMQTAMGTVVSSPSNPRLLTRSDLEVLADFLLDPENFKKKNWDRKEVYAASVGIVFPPNFLRLFDAHIWLDDDVINGVGDLIVRQYRSHLHKMGVLPSYYWINETTPKIALDRLFSEKQRSFWSQCKYLFCPMNTRSHWFLLVIDLFTGRSFFFDSFHGTWSDRATPRMVANKKLLFEVLRSYFPAVSWAPPGFTPTIKTVSAFPTQKDMESCGLYVLHGMECLAAAAQGPEFKAETWDTKRLFLRFHFAVSLLRGRLRALDVDESSSGFSCAECSAPPDFMCRAWNQRFCGQACHEAYAARRGLSYL